MHRKMLIDKLEEQAFVPMKGRDKQKYQIRIKKKLYNTKIYKIY